MAINRISATLLAAALLPLAIGCGDGAAETPKVTLRPSKPEASGHTGNGTTGETTKTNTAAAASGFGTFKGRVVLTGSAPNLPPLVAQGANIKDGAVCAAQPVPNQKLVVGPENGIANVFIYMVKPPKGGKEQAAHEPAEQPHFDQKGCLFVPHAMVVRVGKPVVVKSSDSVLHNVHTRPKQNSEANISLSNASGNKEIVYSKAELEPAEVVCDIHSWMRAYQLPLDHPYGTVTGEDGSFEIADLPVGDHEFRIWHEGKLLNRGFKVKVAMDGQVVEETIPFPTSLLAAGDDGSPTKVVMLSSIR